MRLRFLLVAFVASLSGLAPATTIASAAIPAYDVPPIARVGAQQIEVVAADPIVLSNTREGSAPPQARARGRLTTPIPGVVATNTARPGTDLVKYEAYPPSATSPRGFVGGPVRDTLQPGTAISRYGGEGGTFVSPAGTPFSTRGLPPGHEALGESQYVFAQPLEVDAGIAAYWQGGGGGIQYDLPRSISDLVNDGVLKRLP